MEVTSEQLNILLHAMKEVVTQNNTPEWIKRKLHNAVKEAKEYKNDKVEEKKEKEEIKYSDLYVGMICKSNKDNGECIYKIIREGDTIDNIKLFDLQIIRGNENNPTGYVVYNVPETFIMHQEVNI